MKQIIPCLGLIFLCWGWTGCVVSIGGNRHPTEPSERVVVVPGDSEDRGILAEIDAVGKLNFESSRLEGFKSIAQRPELTPVAQVHLVNASLRRLSFESSRLVVLQTLVQNPSFSNPAKEVILKQLDKLSFDSSRSAILKAINDRGQLEE